MYCLLLYHSRAIKCFTYISLVMKLPEKIILDKLIAQFHANKVLREIYHVFDTGKGYDDMTKNSVSFILHMLASRNDREIRNNKVELISTRDSVADYRFKFLKVRNFRGLSVGPKNQYLGIDFRGIDPKNFPSMIMLGHNGCGKTSFYNAIEYTFTDNISAAVKHGYDLSTARDQRYLNYAFSKDPYSVKIDTLSGTYEIPTNVTGGPLMEYGIHLDPFFCSEADLILYEIENNRSVSQYILIQIGAIRLSDLISLLKASLSDLELVLRKLLAPNSKLDNESTLEDPYKSLKGQDPLEMTEVFNDLMQIIAPLETEVQLLKNEVYQEIHGMLVTLLDGVNFWDKEIEEGFAQKQPDSEIVDGIFINKYCIPLDFRSYLNNFRYKFLTISLNVAIAFYYMQKCSICFPIVLDDVFNASDFRHRNSGVRDYIKTVFDIYYKKFPNWPQLSLILFTQDEVVAEAAFKGICDANRLNSSANKVMLCKMFEQNKVSKDADCVASGGEILFYKLYDVIKHNY